MKTSSYGIHKDKLAFFYKRLFLNVVVGCWQVSSSYNGHVVFETSEVKPDPLFPEGSEDSDPIGGYRLQNTKDTLSTQS
jgi:hypothetical protein